MNGPLVVSTSQAAEELGITSQRVIQLIHAGKIHATRSDDANRSCPWQISRDELDRVKQERAK